MLIGSTAVSSWEPDPSDDEPDEASTPITVRLAPSVVTVCPTALRPPNSSEAVSAPSTTTLARRSTSSWVKNRPLCSFRERTSSHDGVVPASWVVQLVVPATSETCAPVVGATWATSGTTVLSAIEEASCRVSVDALPKPPRTPDDEVLLPGETTSRLLPSELIWSRTRSWAPWPRPTVRITDETPMMMPSMVSAERSRWETIADQPVRRVSAQVMARSRRRARRAPDRPARRPRARG